MTATLNTAIKYANGYITPVDVLEESLDVDDAELVEGGCRGWGGSNAVVRHDGSYYLATVEAATGEWVETGTACASDLARQSKRSVVAADDGTCGYTRNLRAGETAAEALAEFAATYPNRSGLRVRVYDVDGDEIDSASY